MPRALSSHQEAEEQPLQQQQGAAHGGGPDSRYWAVVWAVHGFLNKKNPLCSGWAHLCLKDQTVTAELQVGLR